MSGKIGVLIDADMYAEFILRNGKAYDVADTMENIIQDFLDRTEGDAGIWSDEYSAKYFEQLDDDFVETYGDPDDYYEWGRDLRLFNGSKIRMRYKGKDYFASVRNEKIEFEGFAYSPAQLACKIANGTSRNAWRDLWIKERGSSEWVLADEMRRRSKPKPLNIIEDI